MSLLAYFFVSLSPGGWPAGFFALFSSPQSG
jgi:hypothetical protein